MANFNNIIDSDTTRLDNIKLPNGNTYVMGASIGELEDVFDVLEDEIGDLTDVVTTNERVVAAALNDLSDNKVDVVSGKGLSTEDYTTAEKTKLGDLPTNSELSTALAAKANASSLANYVKTGSYNSSTHNIELKNGSTVLSTINADAFIKDGMVSNVEVKDVTISGETVKCLVITFNTDAGKDDINIPLTDIFDPSNYYTTTQTDTLLGGKVDKVSGKGLSTNDYTTSEKNKLGDLPTNTQLTNALAAKADTSSLGDLAVKDTASGNISATDAGHTHTVSYDKTSKTHSVTQGSVSATGNFTPQGTIGVGSGTANYTPAGSNADSTVTLTGGSTSKLVTTTIKGVSGTGTVHDTPTLNKSSIGSASNWSAGTLFSATVDGETLILTPGVLPSLTITPTDVGTSLTAGKSKTFAMAASNNTTVATGSVNANGGGATVATGLPTGGTAAGQAFTGTAVELAFTGTQGSVSVSGTTSGVAVADHTQTSTEVTTESGTASISGTVTVS